jgi:hypothetical protein
VNENGNRYALAALKDKRASLSSELVQTERTLRHLKEALVHVDATLKLLDPSIDAGAIPNKRLQAGRIKLFRQGELGRLIRDALRVHGGGPVSTAQIVDHVLAQGGHGPAARRAVGGRVRGNLAYLERRGIVTKTGDQREARWQLC